jgi:PI-3-kinase-related kinase SMG-1
VPHPSEEECEERDDDDEEGDSVAAANGKKQKRLDAEVDEVAGSSDILINTAYVALLDTLAKTDKDHVAEVETLVRELRRITLLWDEAWLG